MTDGSCLDTPIRHVAPECFHDGLMKKGISNEKYELYLRISQKLGFHIFQEGLECYLWTDVLAYADVMESFRRTFHREQGIDPMHYLSAPAASMAALKLKLLRDQVDVERVCELNGGMKLLEHVKANICGGLCCCYQLIAQANNPFVPGYDAEKERTWLNYVDWTSLYPDSMCWPLPQRDIMSMEVLLGSSQEEAIRNVRERCETYDVENGDNGYLFTVDYEIPEEYHDKWDLAPPVNMIMPDEELSAPQLERRRFYKSAVGAKLLPHLGPKTCVGHRVAFLQFLLRRGA
jgi:hypothetical protein